MRYGRAMKHADYKPKLSPVKPEHVTFPGLTLSRTVLGRAAGKRTARSTESIHEHQHGSLGWYFAKMANRV
jgi:hypothetical protein